MAYGCGRVDPKPLDTSLRRYEGGMEGFSMYIDLKLDDYIPAMGTRQTGTMDVCFCGMNPTSCSDGSQCTAYAAKAIPVVYTIDECRLDLDIGNECLQSTFSQAFSQVATLQGIIYDAPKDTFHIQALGLKVMTENVVLTWVDTETVWPCKACTNKGAIDVVCRSP